MSAVHRTGGQSHRHLLHLPCVPGQGSWSARAARPRWWTAPHTSEPGRMGHRDRTCPQKVMASEVAPRSSEHIKCHGWWPSEGRQGSRGSCGRTVPHAPPPGRKSCKDGATLGLCCWFLTADVPSSEQAIDKRPLRPRQQEGETAGPGPPPCPRGCSYCQPRAPAPSLLSCILLHYYADILIMQICF